MELFSDAEAVAQIVTNLGNTDNTLAAYTRAAPEVVKPVSANVDPRREAYLQLQTGLWLAFSQSNLLVHVAEVTNRSLFRGRPRDPFGRVL